MKNFEEVKKVNLIDKIIKNIGKVIIGKKHAAELSIVAMISNGHLLIEDVPGVGKTMLARALAISTGCDFNRIQFTPDLLPSDITGASIYNQKTESFEFRPGPVMAQIVLADEINRATPKVQSALLEAMGEMQTTVDGITHLLPSPFMVIATQNSIEYEGTFPLPEAQLDRFFMRISLGYPDIKEEVSIMDDRERLDPINQLEPVCSAADIVELQKVSEEIYIDDVIKKYIVEISDNTRRHTDVALGVSPRASISMMKAGKSIALVMGRDYVMPDDIKNIVPPVLSHRVLLTPSARMRNVNQYGVIQEVLDNIPVPGK
ncbi:MAG: MoxR family ATPase [Dehalococcoidia bacterium]|jgi:MoxR-like ATPase|nr:AAA family ATPase [Chloroflexota bacterium]MDP6426054.1 MoxR family ATPase [Dehalococcoidia bacterium]MDP7232361.1 MoxR family ATPase [Dehalococcoidia bacterium]MDP7613270.1 MoxR family ATPase [Dehalococcoidia bacterium]|tara:strand:- start:4414 stop:5367 length:954 start_codon:yes stop_codon:yes gene_type:complete